ncbi:hypothetical protein Tco_0674823 [Tanacetum coccineum]
MGFVDLLYVASMPILKVLIVIGSFLALEYIDILGQSTTKQLNRTTSTSKGPRSWKPRKHDLDHIPAVCKEKASPFGDPDVCYKYGMAYASLSVDCGIQFFSVHSQDSGNNVVASVNETRTIEIITESTPELTSSNVPINGKAKVMLDSIKKHLGSFSRQFNLKAVFAPPTIGAVEYFIALDMDAAIPVMRRLKGSGISLPLVCGIAVARLIFSPIIGIFIVKGALHLGLVHADPLYLFVLNLQFALPPAMNIVAFDTLFESLDQIQDVQSANQTSVSVIHKTDRRVLLWQYGIG